MTTISTLQAKKQAGDKFSVVAAYDATFASTLCEAGVDAILVGDSLGMVLQGHDSTLPVTMEEMCYHTQCVARGNQSAFIIADMPFNSYSTLEDAIHNAGALMRAGAHMVKLEGGDWLAEIIVQLHRAGIPVCAHLGLTPQSVNVMGGYKVQGKGEAGAEKLINDAQALEAAGAQIILVECIPAGVGAELSQALSVPVIGIGAGNGTDAQVLVLHDLLGLNPRPAKFVRNFMQGADSIQQALANYHQAVIDGSFPAQEHTFK